ncbi:MAG: hypothetical protein KJ697_02295 [Nanoarchaeota archaeon]|nr:hypothetical protein [Nanoarchaeota archaeon]MBU4123944.1 hypothetical protein [Nanoarchaeota archaeon]
MFIFIGEKNCPSCGTVGSSWKKDNKVYICPHCNSFFNEFGIILEPRMTEVSF